MIVDTESFVLYTINFGTEDVYTRVGSRLIGAVERKGIQISSREQAWKWTH
jgi:hypothetical protein